MNNFDNPEIDACIACGNYHYSGQACLHIDWNIKERQRIEEFRNDMLYWWDHGRLPDDPPTSDPPTVCYFCRSIISTWVTTDGYNGQQLKFCSYGCITEWSKIGENDS